jgi:hypothetical protein
MDAESTASRNSGVISAIRVSYLDADDTLRCLRS